MSVHFNITEYIKWEVYDRTICSAMDGYKNKYVDNIKLTKELDEVTCGHCRRIILAKIKKWGA
jgi:hypothetical protein